MNKCSVYICESKTEYEGQYEFMNAGMEVEIFNYHAPKTILNLLISLNIRIAIQTKPIETD